MSVIGYSSVCESNPELYSLYLSLCRRAQEPSYLAAVKGIADTYERCGGRAWGGGVGFVVAGSGVANRVVVSGERVARGVESRAVGQLDNVGGVDSVCEGGVDGKERCSCGGRAAVGDSVGYGSGEVGCTCAEGRSCVGGDEACEVDGEAVVRESQVGGTVAVDGSPSGFGDGRGVGLRVSEPGGADAEELQVSEKTLANRAKRVRKKNRKVRKQGSVVSEGAYVVAAGQGLSSGVNRETVPEWRRGAGRPSFGGGYFSGCSAEVQEELRESRARMLIQQNDLATRKARAEAQADVVARNAELKRLNLDAKLKVAQERRFGVGAASGFAETVVSYGLEDVIPVPSLGGGSGGGSGSVSPDSSISVAQVARMEKALCSLAEKNKELQLKNDVLEKRVAGSARNAFFNPENEGVTMAEVKDAMIDVSYPAEWYMSQVSETDQRILAEAGVMF